jgi:hypothetical protein
VGDILLHHKLEMNTDVTEKLWCHIGECFQERTWCAVERVRGGRRVRQNLAMSTPEKEHLALDHSRIVDCNQPLVQNNGPGLDGKSLHEHSDEDLSQNRIRGQGLTDPKDPKVVLIEGLDNHGDVGSLNAARHSPSLEVADKTHKFAHETSHR